MNARLIIETPEGGLTTNPAACEAVSGDGCRRCGWTYQNQEKDMQTPDTMTLEFAQQLEQEFQTAAATAKAAAERRNEAVLLLAEGGNLRPAAIARELGLSPTRIGQIVQAARNERIEGAA